MNVDQVMSRNVKTCSMNDTLEVAARIMWENEPAITVVSAAPLLADRVTKMHVDRMGPVAVLLDEIKVPLASGTLRLKGEQRKARRRRIPEYLEEKQRSDAMEIREKTTGATGSVL